MKYRALFFLVCFLLATFASAAQDPSSPTEQYPTPTSIRTLPNPSHRSEPKRTQTQKRPRPRHHKKRINYKDSLRIGFKFCYNTDYPYYIESMRMDFENTGGVDFVRSTTLGPALRIPLGRYMFMQTEVLYGFNSDWTLARQEDSFGGRLSYSFSNRTSSYLWVPLYLGVRWAPAKVFALRGFVGGRVDFLLDDWSIRYQGDYYTFVAGGGVDLLRVLSIEMGFQIHMSRFAYIERTGLWFLAAGFMF